MTQQTHDGAPPERPEPDNPVSDPITGSHLMAESRSFETGQTTRHTWGVAARWIAFAMLLIFAILLLYWMAGDRMR